MSETSITWAVVVDNTPLPTPRDHTNLVEVPDEFCFGKLASFPKNRI